ncbi:TonB-dependent receptor [Draconibacterium sediminis]|uniref:TonB-dependent receptor n=1 Tax=Draconibacterium sediminis TaxID=1544798 RepID=UPI0026F0EBEE|nr:TonB-dependent receptor [Draconibacterium sediminis]
MRAIMFFLLVGTMQILASNTYSQTTRLSLSFENELIVNILDRIETESEFYFMYDASVIDVNQRVSINFTNSSITQILDETFKGTNITYKIEDKQIALRAESVSTKADQEQKTVTGKITDSSNSPLPGVTVLVKGTTNGTITDFDGNYSLDNVPEDAILVYSFVGMKTQEIPAAGKSVIDIVLEEETIGLEEVVAIGYGVQKKSVVTGAISSVKAEEMMTRSDTRAEQALQGKTSGVQVVSTSGAPGAGMKIRIRGYSSNGSSDPLYIVDGLRTTDISGLEPTNIESMEVLKDGASAAIYGAEGGNGVILITTKSGSAGESKVSYNFQYTLQSLGRTPELMNAAQYLDYMDESGMSTGMSNPNGYDTDWIDESFETAPMQKHNLTFSGGNEKTNYLASISYLDQKGIVAGDQDYYKRYSGMFNGSRQLKDWLKFGSSIQLSRSVTKSFNEDDEYRGVIANAVLLDPLTPVEYSGEVPSHVQSLIDAGQPVMQADNGNYYGISRYVTGETINPFVQNKQNQSENTITSVMGNIYMDLTPFEGFTFTSKLGLNYMNANNHNYQPRYYYSSEMMNLNASVSESVMSMTYWQWENFASYVKSIDNHNFNVMLGTAISSNEIKTINAAGYPLLKDQESYANLDYIVTQSNSTVGGNTITDNKLSYFGRVIYDYQNKYMFQATVRRDAAGSSILPKDNRWGTFPSLSAGWVITSEDFFPEINWLSYMKLRGSWGQNGSLSNLGNYSYASNLMSSGYALSTLSWSNVNAPYAYPLADGSYATASYPSVLGNNQLTWETSEQLDIGIDFRLFDGKLSLTADYYNKKTKDLITTNTPPIEAGNNASPINGGNVVNKGFDFETSWRSEIGELKYSISANLSTLKNEVTYLDPTISRITGASVNRWTATAFEKGYPVWYFRGYKTNGIIPETGDINIVDINNDGQINSNDFTYIGSAIPDITFGATLNLEYKNFDMTVFAQGQSGNDVLMGMLRTDRPTTNKLSLFYTDRWTPSNTNASRPAATVDENYWNSDQMLFDGSFIKIKQVQLGYTVPKNLSDRLKIGKTRVYMSLDDYFIFTKYPGMDPEAASTSNNSIGIDRGFFPISKKVLFGLSLNF